MPSWPSGHNLLRQLAFFFLLLRLKSRSCSKCIPQCQMSNSCWVEPSLLENLLTCACIQDTDVLPPTLWVLAILAWQGEIAGGSGSQPDILWKKQDDKRDTIQEQWTGHITLGFALVPALTDYSKKKISFLKEQCFRAGETFVLLLI